MAKTQAPLMGKELLQKVKDLQHLSKKQMAQECGYYSVGKEGKTRTNLAEFYDALLAAKGIVLEPDKDKDGRGREATYTVTVHKNGQIVLGSAYTKEMGLEPGDEFQIKLGYKHIHLIQMDAEEE
jgi:hypothetical protein